MTYTEKLSQLLCLILISLYAMSVTQAQVTRDLVGQISLDIAPAVKDLIVDISVRNHSFIVIPPTFTILRPIQSIVSTRVLIAEGDSSALYSLSGIVQNPVDYTIQIKCSGCEDIIPTQYYSPQGNRFGLADSTYIDPEDLPAQLALLAITRATIAGKINLLSTASKDLDFTVEVAADEFPDFIYATNSSLKMSKGDQTLNYQISGLARSSNLLQVSLRCRNCLGTARRKRLFKTPLSSQSNHSNIDFTLADEGLAIISPLINLLLDNPN